MYDNPYLENSVELYYRKPGSDDYVKIDESLDEIFIRLEELERILNTSTTKD